MLPSLSISDPDHLGPIHAEGRMQLGNTRWGLLTREQSRTHYSTIVFGRGPGTCLSLTSAVAGLEFDTACEITVNL